MANSFTTVDTSTGGDSTLSITRVDIKTALGRMSTFSRTPGQWSPTTVSDMNAVIKSGENGFYRPLRLPGESFAHKWSFLEPIMDLPIVANTADYDLPSDFGGFVDPVLSFQSTDNQIFQVTLTDIGEILRKRQNEPLNSYSQPLFAAETWLTGIQTGGQRKRLMLFPTPQRAGTLTGPYASNPNAISDLAPYPLGGQPHAETLLASVLAAYELHMNDERGPRYTHFVELLVASVDFDRRMGPKLLGFNRHPGGRRLRFEPWMRRAPSSVVTPF